MVSFWATLSWTSASYSCELFTLWFIYNNWSSFSWEALTWSIRSSFSAIGTLSPYATCESPRWSSMMAAPSSLMATTGVASCFWTPYTIYSTSLMWSFSTSDLSFFFAFVDFLPWPFTPFSFLVVPLSADIYFWSFLVFLMVLAVFRGFLISIYFFLTDFCGEPFDTSTFWDNFSWEATMRFVTSYSFCSSASSSLISERILGLSSMAKIGVTKFECWDSYCSTLAEGNCSPNTSDFSSNLSEATLEFSTTSFFCTT